MQNLSNFKIPKKFRGASIVKVQLWWFIYSFFFKPSPQFMYAWRRTLLRLFGAEIGRKVIIRSSAEIIYPWKVSIGENSWIGDRVVLYSLGNIKIGNDTVIPQECYLCSGTHKYNSDDFDIMSKDIIIGSKCWIATDVFIAPGIIIGDAAIVGARSSVFTNLDSQKIYVGSPAKFLKERKFD